MPDYMFLMHAPEGPTPGSTPDWGPYLAGLRASGQFQGGSAIGHGQCLRKSGEAPPITSALSGFIRVSATDMDDACSLLAGNPVFEAGGVVEIRELPRTDGDAAERPVDPSGLFQNQRMNQVVFQNCGMADARFDDVNLAGASFTNVNLRGAKLADVNMTGVAIDNANIEGLTVLGHDVQALIHARRAK
ncbi:MAG: hypothetical protein JWM33_2537 [Caulobacteraceae bacterium]|nr:hypothetical protein [Caulobacteraceae bacterium]